MAITLGVDLGRTSLKLVAVAGGRTPSVVWTAHLPREGATGAELGELVRRLRSLAKGPFESVISALSSEAASLLLFPMPFTNPKLIEKTMAGEVEGLVPNSIEGHQLALQVLSTTKQGAQVAVGVAPAAVLRDHLDVLTTGGLEPRIVDLDVLTLATLATALDPGAAPYAIADVGASTTRLLVLAEGRVRAVRIIPGGGEAVTHALEFRHGLERAAAETLKVDLTTRYSVSPGGEPAGSSEEAGWLQTVRDGYVALADDLAVSLRAIEHKERIEIGRLWLVGGAARARGFEELASEHTGGDAQVPRPPSDSNADPGWWPDGAVALGLALRGARATHGSALNFRHGAFAYGRDVREVTRRVAPLAVPIAAILIAGLLSFTVRYETLASEARVVRARVLEEFGAEFPNVPIQDPELQIRQYIKNVDKKLAVFTTSAPPAEVLRAVSAAAPADLDVTLDSVTVETGHATMVGRADRFESIERLKSALDGTGPFGDVRIQDQSKDGSQVRFTMVLDLPQDSNEEAS